MGLAGASGCVKRMPAPRDVRTDCRSARSFFFEQVAGACAPKPDLSATNELFERCDDATLAQAGQRLSQQAGLDDVQVLRGPRRPGTDRHTLLVRYASSEAGSCPAQPRTEPLFCEDCGIGETLVMSGPLPCRAPFLFKKVREEARIEGCRTEQLDAARERLWETGWFKDVEVTCNKKEGRVAVALVDVEPEDPQELCSVLVPGYVRKPRCAEVKPKPPCPGPPVCREDFNGCEVCSCGSTLEKFLGELWRLPLLFK
jgi:hypothetical protein